MKFKPYIRSLLEYVEDMLSNGRTAKEILIVAGSTRWHNQKNEIRQILLSFSGKLKNKYIN